MNRSRETQTTLRRHRMEEIWETFGLPGRGRGNGHLPCRLQRTGPLKALLWARMDCWPRWRRQLCPLAQRGNLGDPTSQGDWATTVDRPSVVD